MLRTLFILLIISAISSCASTSSKIYKNGALTANSKYSIAFAYETGEEEISRNSDGIERKIIKKGHQSNFLALKDNIYFSLMDKGVNLVDKSQSPSIIIELHPTTRTSNCRVTCGAINTLSVVFRETASNKPVARIVANNGTRTGTTMDETEFANYSANKIYSLIKSK